MRTYKFKMYPTSEEREKLFFTLNSCRFTYNKLLEYISTQDKLDRTNTGHHIVELKKEHYFLKNIYSKTLQTERDKLFSSIKGLSQSKKKGNKIGRLRFKSRNRFTSFTYNQSGFKIIETDKRYNKLHLSKIGDIRFKQSRAIEGKIKQVQIKLKPSGWYSYIITDGKYECKNINNNEIGIDLGVMSFITTSNKEVFDNPLYMNKSLSKIKILSKQLSRTKKGSNNRRKVIHKLLRLWETIDNQKKDYFHKI
ncbi:MAG: RNA-guided endonuclease InsQ/TnpB family protein [Atribacterota bacterium]